MLSDGTGEGSGAPCGMIFTLLGLLYYYYYTCISNAHNFTNDTESEALAVTRWVHGKGKGKRYRYVDLYSALDDKYLVLKALRHGSLTHSLLRLTS